MRGCGVCQRKSKYKPKRAPVVERPVLSEPFEDVAVDIVGPLAKGKGGCRFLLTYVSRRLFHSGLSRLRR